MKIINYNISQSISFFRTLAIQLDRHIFLLMIISIAMLLIFTSGCITTADTSPRMDPVPAGYYDEMDTHLQPVISTISGEMKNVTSAVWNTARELDGLSPDDPAADIALLKLRRDVPFSFEAVMFDKNETLIASSIDIDKTGLINSGKATYHYTEEELEAAGQECIVSGYGPLLYDDTGVTVTTAIYDAEGNYNGTLRVGLNTGYLFSGITEALRNEYGYTLWVTQTDGLVIFDQDSIEIGRNLVTDSIYQIPSLQNMVKNALGNESGNNSYIFYDETWMNLVQTNTVWDTVSPGYGTEWRIVLSDNVAENSDEKQMTTTPGEMKNFVQKAYIYTMTEGKEAALAEFNNPNGEFIDGELYIFAYDMNGTILALPYQPGLVGENRWSIEDSSGVKIVQRGVARAEQGGGYVLYLYPNPTDGYAQEFKLSYVMAVDNDWFIGAGMYIYDDSFTQTKYINWQEKKDLIRQVRNMQYLSKTESISAVIEMIEDGDSDVQEERLYPFAFTENGTILAASLDPLMSGTNNLGFTNSYDMSVVREMISLAQDGGGLMHSLIWDPITQKENNVLIYIEPADSTIYFGSILIIE